jgi:site-specific DNA-methyltransferase (adenine-specific)
MQTIQLKQNDCIEEMKGIPDDSIFAVITDPPYLISFMSQKWDTVSTTSGDPLEADDDDEESILVEDLHAMEVFHVEWLREAFRILKPGGVAKVFAATRTQHRLATAMESVGFILDSGKSMEAWSYASGFPKSLNISKNLDRLVGAEREIIGTTRGVGGQNMNDIVNGRDTIRTTDEPGGKGVGAYGTGAKQVAIDIPITSPATEEAKQFEGFGTSLKPAWEIFIVGRKPLC